MASQAELPAGGVDGDELEQIAVTFDKIREVRSAMPGNDDRLLAD